MKMKYYLALFCLLAALPVSGQDTVWLKVHFVYGSKPIKAFKQTERKWFGGILGGHVGIEGDTNRIISFMPKGEFHWFADDQDRHSRFAVHSRERFYAWFGNNPDSIKKAIVYIPVSREQKMKFDSISNGYLGHTPYDYAFIGMRCGAAAYDLLAQIGVLPQHSIPGTSVKIFYPRLLRKRLFRKAAKNGWPVLRGEGTAKRKWERDL